MAIVLQKAGAGNHARVKALVQTVVDETYGGLWAEPPLDIDDEDWSQSWLALLDGTLAGIVLTHRDWVGDLWVLKQARRRGVGARLLALAEEEIAGRGCSTARLRVFRPNAAAREFYERRGWSMHHEHPHETLPVTVVEMRKAL